MSRREEWIVRVQAWRESGLTCAAYASEAGVNMHTLKKWAYRLRREARGRDAASLVSLERDSASVRAQFREVSQPSSSWWSSDRIEVAVGKVVVRIPGDVDVELLRSVLGVVVEVEA